MGYMFYEANAFNQPLNLWTVNLVENFDYMFERAYSFSQDLDDWDVSHTSDWTVSMHAMFREALSFDAPVGSWNTE